jgi:uncharacterized protein DUF6455
VARLLESPRGAVVDVVERAREGRVVEELEARGYERRRHTPILRQVKKRRRRRARLVRVNGTPPIMEELALLSSTVILVGLLLVIGVMVWRRTWEASSLQLDEMLFRQGEAVARAALSPPADDFSLIVRSCAACKASRLCRAWLDTGRRDGYAAFCPNAAFIDRMKRVATAP